MVSTNHLENVDSADTPLSRVPYFLPLAAVLVLSSAPSQMYVLVPSAHLQLLFTHDPRAGVHYYRKCYHTSNRHRLQLYYGHTLLPLRVSKTDSWHRSTPHQSTAHGSTAHGSTVLSGKPTVTPLHHEPITAYLLAHNVPWTCPLFI
jgi:hypothetical protein